MTPRALRHSNATLLRAKGKDIATIALWLGHESTQATQMYLHADMKIKEQTIERTATLGTQPGRYRPPDALLSFLADGGSDRLIDALVAWGDEQAVIDRVRDHLDAGADHVALQAYAGERRPAINALEGLAPGLPALD